MPVLVVCSNCSTKLSAPDAAVGKRVKCPKCAAAIPVPGPAPAEVVDEPPPVKVEEPVRDDDEGPRQKKRRAEDDDDDDERPRRKPRAARDDDHDNDRTRRKKQAKKSGGMLVVAVVGGVLLLGGAGFAAYWFGFRDQEPETAAAPAPNPNPAPLPASNPDGPNPPAEGKHLTSDWKEHGDDARGFRVSLPWAAATLDQSFGWGVGDNPTVPGVERATIQFAHKYGPGTGNDRITARFALIAIHYRPNATELQQRSALDRAAEVDTVAFGLKAGPVKQLFWDGQPTRETRYTAAPAPNGKTRRAVIRKFGTSAFGFVGVVLDWGDLTPGEIDRFYDSLKLTRYTKPVDPTRPAPPPVGWAAHYDIVGRFIAHAPGRGRVTVRDARLARTEELGESKVLAGRYWELRDPDRGLVMSVRMLQFSGAAQTAEARAETLLAYLRLIAEPGQTNDRLADVPWHGLDAVEQTSDVVGGKQVRRLVVNKSLGFVVTVRGTNPKEFDALKGPLFEHFVMKPGVGIGRRVLRKGWQAVHLRGATFYAEMPAPVEKANELDKVLAAAKLTGGFHTSAAGGITLHAGHITYATGSTLDEQRKAREELVKALARSVLPLPDVANVPIADNRVRQDYQRRGTATEPGFVVQIYEYDGGAYVLSAHGVGVFSAPDAKFFFDCGEPQY